MNRKRIKTLLKPVAITLAVVGLAMFGRDLWAARSTPYTPPPPDTGVHVQGDCHFDWFTNTCT